MDFFQSQDDARRRTRLLLVLFAVSVAVLVLLLYVLLGFVQGWEHGFLDTGLLAMSAGFTGVVVSLGSGFKILQLSGGGAVVARDLGGRALDPATTNPDERRLLNIVEEMSLASGIPVPEVWIMDDEEGINAFAAGHNPADAVVGVTRGCLRALSRDELQGVIAHEFSHILNGDMRLNLRLIGVVHGLLVIAILGRIILRVTSEMRGGGGGRKEGADPRLVMLAFGVGLLVIGYLGVFLGNMIKSAISRQREYLADASAVQFTRNPDSIGGALLKIGGYERGSKLRTARAEEASHLMFSNAMGNALSHAMATHPPLEKRIKAILPHWDGTFPRVTLPEIEAGKTRRVPVSAHPEGALAGFLDIRQKITAAEAHNAVNRIGQPTDAEMATARLIGAGIPPELSGLLRDSAGAQAVVMAMLLSENPAARGREEAALEPLVDPRTAATVRETATLLDGWHSSRVIALIDLALPSLRRLTPSEYTRFSDILRALIDADGRIDLFEFMLQKVVRRHLDFYFRRVAPPGIEVRRFTDAPSEAATLLSAFAGLSGPPGSAANRQSMDAARQSLRDNGILMTLEAEAVSLERLDTALDRFDRASPMVKKQLLHACASAATADGHVSSEEAELLRALADTIGCPVPPFPALAVA